VSKKVFGKQKGAVWVKKSNVVKIGICIVRGVRNRIALFLLIVIRRQENREKWRMNKMDTYAPPVFLRRHARKKQDFPFPNSMTIYTEE